LGVRFEKEGNRLCAVQAFQAALQAQETWDTHFNYGLALSRGADHSLAAQEFQAAARLAHGSSKDLLVIANAQASVEDLAAAERTYRKVLEMAPNSQEALYGLGTLLLSEKNAAGAIPFLERAAQLNPAHHRYALDLAVALGETGEYAKSEKLLREILEKDPGNAEAYYDLAVVAGKQNRCDEAIQDYRLSLTDAAIADRARFGLATCLNLLAQYAQAEPYANEFLARHPDDRNGLVLAAKIESGLEKWPQAEELLERATKIGAADPELEWTFGSVLRKEGKLPAAVGHLNRAVQLAPESPEAHFQRAAALKAVGDQAGYESELKAVQKLKQRSQEKNRADLIASRANEALRTGDYQEAIQLYREALKLDTVNAKTYYNLALAWDKAGNRGEEQAALEHSLQLDPQLARAHNQLGIVFLSSAQWNRAAEEFDRALQSEPHLAEAQNNLGIVRSRQGRVREAAQCFGAATSDRPEYGPAWLNLALTLAAEGKFLEAAGPAETAIQLMPDDEAALTGVGMIRAKNGRSAEAIALLRRAAEIKPSSAQAHLNLGIALGDSGDQEGAVHEFSRVTEIDPANAAAHYSLGRALLETNHLSKAKEELYQCLQLDRNHRQALYFLAVAESKSSNPEQSARLLEHLIQLEPQNASAHAALGRSDLDLKRTALAEAEWRKAIALDPENEQSLYGLVQLLRGSRPEEAHQFSLQLAQVEKERHQDEQVKTLGTAGLEAARQKHWREAIAATKNAIEECGACHLLAQLQKNLGLIYAQAGETDQAILALHKAEALLPNDPEIARALQLVDRSH
jgi:tetratricopeptide (TPR) repeat protein